ncbi:MAG: YicC family protein [Proteobacteria bacterium]|nr:YicC family protein [Pseudomonadota bacterium]MBU1736540.1 YicC family protein [Pseudomonadota bacterium]
MKRPLSMTAFGRGECCHENRTWIAEIKSVNHRFCDIKIRIPRNYGALEEKIKKEVESCYSRGHVEVTISCNGSAAATMHLKTDIELARQYLTCMNEISSALHLEGNVDLALLLANRDLIVPEDTTEDLDRIWDSAISPALREALANAEDMRANEGANLRKDLIDRLVTFSKAADTVEKMVPELLREKETTLRERLAVLLDKLEIDPARLAQEVAIMADKLDVTEELVRLRSHIDQFTGFFDLDEPIGRRLDFLIQEFLRETNTMASKIANAEIAHLSVELKNELEKMREQVQNLE